jgi:predicted O-methyltransferase YrrM
MLEFCPTLKQMIAQGTATGLTGKEFNVLPALSTFGNLQILRQLIIKKKVASSLEIGLAFGGSALTMLATMREIHRDAEFQHTAIDPLQNTVWDGVGLNLIDKEKLNDRFVFYEQYSCYVLPRLAMEQCKYDLIYVDGSHLFEDVFVDFYFASDLLQVGGIVVFDDCTDAHVAKLIRFVQRNYANQLSEIDLAQFVGPMSLTKKLARFCGYCQARGFQRTANNRRPWNAALSSF